MYVAWRARIDMKPIKNTFAATNTLKGIAVGAVLVNHYLNMNVSGDCTGFANLWIGIFFMLSGFGIHYSLDRLFCDRNTPFFKKLIRFYLLRAFRIFPMYWMAYIFECLLFRQKISFLALLGIHGTEHYWFIAAILQCYLIAPAIFLSLVYRRIWALIGIPLVFVLSNIILNAAGVPQGIVSSLDFVHLYWRGMYFLYFFIFSMAMFLPEYISSWSRVPRFEKLFYFYMSFFIVMLFMVASKYHNNLQYLYNIMAFTFLPLLFLCITSMYAIVNDISIKYMSKLGEVSFAVYLFHMIFFRLINRTLGIGNDSIVELAVCIVCFPVFYICCKYLQQIAEKMTSFAKAAVHERTGSHCYH